MEYNRQEQSERAERGQKAIERGERGEKAWKSNGTLHCIILDNMYTSGPINKSL